MHSVSNKVIKKTVSFTVPEAVYEKLVMAAQSNGQSLAAHLRNIVAASVMRWKAPAGAVEGAGYTCGQCARPATECKHPKEHKASGMWND